MVGGCDLELDEDVSDMARARAEQALVVLRQAQEPTQGLALGQAQEPALRLVRQAHQPAQEPVGEDE